MSAAGPPGHGPAGSLTEGEVLRTLVRLALPMLLGIVAIMLFNLVDAFYISRLGTLELAAISFTFPVVAFVASLTLGIGVGLTAAISQEIGAGRRDRVRELTRDGLLLGLFIVALFSSAGLGTIEPLFRAMGADETTLPFVKEYMDVWYLGVIFLVVPMVGNSAIRATGDARSPALIMTASALLNAMLDPLFIFGAGPVPAMGVRGAAIASVIARSGTLVIALLILVRRERLVSFALPRPAELMRHWGEVLHVGAPAAATNLLGPVSLAVLTRIVAAHGVAAIAGFGAGSRVQMFMMVIPIAWASALTPFVGQNWGARLIPRVREALRLSRYFAILSGLLGYGLISFFAPSLAALFTDRPETAASMLAYLRLGIVGFPFTVMLIVAVSAFNALRRPLRSAALNLMRLFLFLLPLAWLGSRLYGAPGIFVSVSISNALAGLVALLWLRGAKLDPRPQMTPR